MKSFLKIYDLERQGDRALSGIECEQIQGGNIISLDDLDVISAIGIFEPQAEGFGIFLLNTSMAKETNRFTVSRARGRTRTRS